jgi:hypothetical protein
MADGVAPGGRQVALHLQVQQLTGRAVGNSRRHALRARLPLVRGLRDPDLRPPRDQGGNLIRIQELR